VNTNDALVLHPDDSVATALRPLQAGQNVEMTVDGQRISVVLREPIALCHKFALHELGAGATVFKYGESIGQISEPVRAGDLVHVHNLRSRRA
jgi:altronate dehydratase small subunit